MGDKLFLKASQVKGFRSFNVKGKLSTRYIRSYDIIKKLNPMAYGLDLSAKLEHVRNIFHIT